MTISGSDWGGKYVSRSRSEGKENVQHLNQTLAVINDLAYIRDLFPTGVLHSFEPGDKVLFKTWKTASPESQPEEMWTDPCDVLLTTARHGEAGRNKTLDSSHQSKENTRGTIDHQTSRKPESYLSKTMTYNLFITFCLTLCYRDLVPFK